jgi:hypothetical protein
VKEESMIEKLHQIAREEKSLRAIEKKGLLKLKKERGMRKILPKDNKKHMKNWSVRQEGQCITSHC